MADIRADTNTTAAGDQTQEYRHADTGQKGHQTRTCAHTQSNKQTRARVDGPGADTDATVGRGGGGVPAVRRVTAAARGGAAEAVPVSRGLGGDSGALVGGRRRGEGDPSVDAVAAGDGGGGEAGGGAPESPRERSGTAEGPAESAGMDRDAVRCRGGEALECVAGRTRGDSAGGSALAAAVGIDGTRAAGRERGDGETLAASAGMTDGSKDTEALGEQESGRCTHTTHR